MDKSALHFDGKKNPARRTHAEKKGWLEEHQSLYPVYRYTKIVPTYAARIPIPFTVDTLEGMHSGKAGDYLAIGAHGEMYPIDADVMESTYRGEVGPVEIAPHG